MRTCAQLSCVQWAADLPVFPLRRDPVLLLLHTSERNLMTITAPEAISQVQELDAAYNEARMKEMALAEALDDAKAAYDQASEELTATRRNSGLSLARIVREVGADLILDPQYKAVAERVYRYIQKEDSYGYPAAIADALNEATQSVTPVNFYPGQSVESILMTVYTDSITSKAALTSATLFIAKAYENYRATQREDADLIVQVADRNGPGTRWTLRAAVWKAGSQWTASRVDERNFDQEMLTPELPAMVQSLLAIGLRG